MLYGFGSNGCGQLGVGHTDDLAWPQEITVAESDDVPWRVKQLAAGGNHTLILCTDGKVRATGSNEDGRCGIKHKSQLLSFTEIDYPRIRGEALSRIIQVSATWAASFLLFEDGTMFTSGTGTSGELGLGKDVTCSTAWQQIPPFAPPESRIVRLVSSMAHTIAVLSNGEVYGWGNGRKGQIGKPAENTWCPRQVEEIEFEAAQVACGKDFTYVVSAASSGKANLLGLESRDRFNLKGQLPPRRLDWVSVDASWGSIFGLQDSGKVTAWGRNDHGQLPGEDLPEIESIAAGSEHCLALTKTGKVLAWGWGEHGNCAEPTDAGDVKGRFNEIKIGHPISNVFAGCATSFLQSVD